MRFKRGIRLLLSVAGIGFSAAGGGIAGLLIMAMLHPGPKGPNITDDQAIGALVLGAFVGGGLASFLVVWIAKTRRR
jgi:hypothetical protein